MKKTYPENTWSKFIKEIRKCFKEDNISNFLNWGPIKRSMRVSDEPHIPLLDYFEINMTKFSKLNNIFEFGGGHGRVCRMIFDRGFKGKYTIFDFPELIRIQKYYLKDYSNVDYLFDYSRLVSPSSSGKLFLSMSALEECPKGISDVFFNFAKEFDHYIFKYGGGAGRFETFVKEVKGTWKHNPKFTKSTQVMVGKIV
jgi:hypothetical protein